MKATKSIAIIDKLIKQHKGEQDIYERLMAIRHKLKQLPVILLLLISSSAFSQGNKVVLVVPTGVAGTDTTSISNRINSKLAIGDTAAMLLPYLRKADTATLSNRINGKISHLNVSGNLFNLSSIPDAAQRNFFTTSGAAAITAGSGELTLTSIATVSTSNIVNVPLDMANEQWTQVIRIRCNVTTGTQRIGVGTRPSNNANINRGFSYTFDVSSGADKGKGFIFTGNGGTFTQRAVSAALPLSNNDVIELTVQRNGYTFDCKSKNITTGDSVTVSYDYPVTSTSEPVMLPTSRPAIYQLNQANQTVLSWSFTDNTPTNPYLLVIGDSKTAGHNATTAAGRYVSQLQAAHPDSVVVFSGYGDELTDAVKWLALVRKVRPQNVVIALGSNDVRNSRTEAATLENLSRLYEACKFVGANVYYLAMGENSINQSFLWQQAMAMVGSDNMIITYPALAGDGVHLLNTAAHTTVATSIETKLF